MAGLCIKTTPSSEKDYVLMKNEHDLYCCIYTDSDKTGRCKRIVEDMVGELACCVSLVDWNVALGTEIIADTGRPKTMVKHSVSLLLSL